MFNGGTFTCRSIPSSMTQPVCRLPSEQVAGGVPCRRLPHRQLIASEQVQQGEHLAGDDDHRWVSSAVGRAWWGGRGVEPGAEKDVAIQGQADLRSETLRVP